MQRIKAIFSKKNRVLLAELVRTDFKLRYQGSVLGYAWSLLRPLFLFLILYIVFVKFLKIGGSIEHYPIYLLLGIVLWNFFVEMTVQSLGAIVGRGDLIRKIKIPRWTIIVSTSFSALINLGFNLLVVAVFMVVNHVNILSTTVFFPLTVLQIYLFSLGVSLFLAASFVRYRDITYIWEVLLQAGFYATPILYPLSLVTSVTLQKLIFMNPMAQAIQDARYEVVTHNTITISQVFDGGPLMFVPYVLTVVVLIAGVMYFKKHSSHFAEDL